MMNLSFYSSAYRDVDFSASLFELAQHALKNRQTRVLSAHSFFDAFPHFDATKYRDTNMDLQRLTLCECIGHFWLHGKIEGRSPVYSNAECEQTKEQESGPGSKQLCCAYEQDTVLQELAMICEKELGCGMVEFRKEMDVMLVQNSERQVALLVTDIPKGCDSDKIMKALLATGKVDVVLCAWPYLCEMVASHCGPGCESEDIQMIPLLLPSLNKARSHISISKRKESQNTSVFHVVIIAEKGDRDTLKLVLQKLDVCFATVSTRFIVKCSIFVDDCEVRDDFASVVDVVCNTRFRIALLEYGNSHEHKDTPFHVDVTILLGHSALVYNVACLSLQARVPVVSMDADVASVLSAVTTSPDLVYCAPHSVLDSRDGRNMFNRILYGLNSGWEGRVTRSRSKVHSSCSADDVRLANTIHGRTASARVVAAACLRKSRLLDGQAPPPNVMKYLDQLISFYVFVPPESSQRDLEAAVRSLEIANTWNRYTCVLVPETSLCDQLCVQFVEQLHLNHVTAVLHTSVVQNHAVRPGYRFAEMDVTNGSAAQLKCICSLGSLLTNAWTTQRVWCCFEYMLHIQHAVTQNWACRTCKCNNAGDVLYCRVSDDWVCYNCSV